MTTTTSDLRRNNPSSLWIALGALLAAAAAVQLGLGLSQPQVSKTVLLAPLVLVAGLGLVALAATRFDLFVATILVLRATLDALKVGTGRASLAEPASLLSILFIGVAGIWLLLQRREQGRMEPHPATRPFLLLLAAAALSLVFSVDAASGATEWIRLATNILILFALNRLLTDENRAKMVIGALFLSALVPLLMAGYQQATGSGLHESGEFHRVQGTFLHPNPFAIYLTLLIVFGVPLIRYLSPRLQLYARLVIPAGLVALVFTYTRSAWIAILVGLLVVALILSKRMILIIGLLVVVTLASAPVIASRFADLSEPPAGSGSSSNSLTWRFEFWEETLNLSRNPVFGAGLRTIEGSVAEEKLPHNDFVRVFVEMGTLGLIAYVWLLLSLLGVAREALRSRSAFGRSIGAGFMGALIAFFVLSFVSNIISQLVLLWYFVPMAALAWWAARTLPEGAGKTV